MTESTEPAPEAAVKAPLLASEVLREDVAPLEPSRVASRLWILGIGLSLLLLGAALRGGLGVNSQGSEAASITFAAAGAALAVAVLPFAYGLRAGVIVAVGSSLMILGLQGLGPLGLTRAHWAEDLCRFAALTALPAALLFRANYRAYLPARRVLAVAMLSSLPLLLLEGATIWDASVPVFARGVAGLACVSIGLGLLGFMGSDTTAGGTTLAALVLLVLSAEVAIQGLVGRDAVTVAEHTAAAVGLLCAAVLSSLGVYQLLAAALAGDARRVSGASDPPSAI